MCLIIDAGSAGVSPATTEGRISYRQTILPIRHKPAERGFIGIHNPRKQTFGLIKHPLTEVELWLFVALAKDGRLGSPAPRPLGAPIFDRMTKIQTYPPISP